MASILNEFKQRPRFSPVLIHTGQHYSPEMSDTFFEQLQLPKPDVNLEVGPGTQTEQTAEIMRRLEPVFAEQKPGLILIVGDVNSTLAAALVGSKLLIPIAHVEAGLRSFDRTMPEEINRLVTDILSDFLFTSEPSGTNNLLAEGIPNQKIFFVGNVMIDTLLRFRTQAAATSILRELGLKPKSYAVATLHRPANVDNPGRLRDLIGVLRRLAQELTVVFPVHPRTKQRLAAENIDTTGVLLTQPLGYLEFLQLNAQSRLVLTDSGGIQEETTILNVPCLTLRENTERPATIGQGTNQLVGVDPDVIEKTALQALAAEPSQGRGPDLWDGKASIRILDILQEKLG